jgi:hypothetical protein
MVDLQNDEVRVRVPTSKLILVIVDLYRSHDANMQQTALDLAGCVIEAYNDQDKLKKDIFNSYVSGGSNMVVSRKNQMKRLYPNEFEVLVKVFGAFLTGG